MEARMKAISSYIEILRPTVIALQEVTTESLQIIKSQKWMKYFTCSANILSPRTNVYFVVLLSQVPVHLIESYPFENSIMGRELLCAQIAVNNNESIVIGTTHLESLPQFQTQRLSQLRKCFNLLKRKSNHTTLGAILMGDFNISIADELLLQYSDVYNVETVPQILIEPAITGRSTCVLCKQNIDKGAWRVGRKHPYILPNGQFKDIIRWQHVACFLIPDHTNSTDIAYVTNYLALTQSTDRQHNTEVSKSQSSNWKDVWLMKEENTHENGLTFDGKTNSLISKEKFQGRYDRIYYYSNASLNNKMELISIEKIGVEPISEGIFPSDHFGLFAVFEFRSDNEV